MENNKVIIGLFRNRLNIGTLELLDNGEYLFIINFDYRKRLIEDNFPFDYEFKQNETILISKTLPHLFADIIPHRSEELKRYGITPDDNEWSRLIKSAIHEEPKKDNTYILTMPVSK
ncbi:MAG: hypothetical protein FWE11_01685 [Defluviitaleaceae bacterium]|nr:hypothetical protein [Defluviitaleaceae bacterium]